VSSFSSDLVALLPRLRRFARALVGHPDRADDLVQDAVERALRAEAQFIAGTRLDSWVFRILRNAWLDGHRRRAARGGEHEDLDAALDVAGSDGRKVSAFRDDLMDAERAMLRLPSEQREALVLTAIEGLTFAEAAEVLGVPAGTVMSRSARGRIALAEAMGKGRRP
jgi:RNA polymerase sigma-70 factor (ECF subfamily)